MSKHTPAPWNVNTTDYTNAIGIECVVNGIAHTVCTDQFCYPNFQQHGSEEKLANAKLIAAAPELLEALQMLSEWNDKYPPNKVYSYDRAKVIETALTEIVEKAKSAIKKATL